MLYLDASALVKRYVEEDGTVELLGAMEEAEGWVTCRITYVETVRAVSRSGGEAELAHLKSDWDSIDIVEVDRALADNAAELAVSSGLKTLDALHLAAALVLPQGQLTLATWDARLQRAASRFEIETIPAAIA